MDTLVVLFDKTDPLRNILSVHCFLPKRVIYLVDFEADGNACVDGIRRSFVHAFLQMPVGVKNVSYKDEASIRQACEKINGIYPNPVFDISGGNSVAALAVSSYCGENNCARFFIDSEKGRFINLGGADIYSGSFSLPVLSLDEFIEPVGASIIGNMHACPEENWQDNILRYARIVLNCERQWQHFCSYLQEVTDEKNRDSQKCVFVSAPTQVAAGHKTHMFDPELAKYAVRYGFMENLSVSSGRVSFRYPNETFRQYMTSQGVWLEMYLYIMTKRLRFFDHSQMSVLIDWNGIEKEEGNVVNEIDLVVSKGILPAFISCKTSIPVTDDLNEISLYAKKFGGNQAIPVIATTTDIQQVPIALLNRAEEMKVLFWCHDDIRMRSVEKTLLSLAEKLTL